MVPMSDRLFMDALRKIIDSGVKEGDAKESITHLIDDYLQCLAEAAGAVPNGPVLARLRFDHLLEDRLGSQIARCSKRDPALKLYLFAYGVLNFRKRKFVAVEASA